MALTKEQKEQVAMQLKRHDRDNVKSKIDLDQRTSLEIIVARGVFGSDIMSSGIYLARFLYQHRDIYRGRICLDMGCGPGTQGLIMAVYGADKVDLSDINPNAVINTNENIKLHHVGKVCRAYVSDLFKNLPKRKKYEVIVFNHPFFPEEAENFGNDVFDDEMLRKSMLGGTELLKRFLKEVKTHLKDNESIIIMPYFHFAGKENDPAVHVEKYGLFIQSDERIKSQQGLQLGDFSIYTIKQK
jgi:methylase of polypeptide subunit release factors